MYKWLAVLGAGALIVAGQDTGAHARDVMRAVASSPVAGAPGCPIFPADNVWNADVSALPTATDSAAMISSIGTGTGLHPDFGSNLSYGIPYNVVAGSQAKVPVTFDYAGESDPGPYPIPSSPQIEAGSDAHMLIVDKDNCYLYEMWDTRQVNGQWQAGSGAIWNLRSNALRPDGWTSADAAGLPILPGLVRYEEVAGGVIDHALRFTAAHTQSAHIYPARHDAGVANAAYPPMGLRVRLKASISISGFTPQVQVLLTALKKYGMILADNGSNWYISGVSNPSWNDDDLHKINQIVGSDFEVVDTSSLVNGPDPSTTTPTAAGQTLTGTPTVTATPTSSPSPAVTATGTPTAPPTATTVPSSTPTRAATSTTVRTSIPSPSRTPLRTATSTATRTRTAAPSRTPTRTAVPSRTPTRTAAPSRPPTRAAVPSRTPTRTAVPSRSRTRTATPTATVARRHFHHGHTR